MSDSGVFTPKSVGTAIVTAYSKQDVSKNGSVILTIKNPAPSNLVYPKKIIANVGEFVQVAPWWVGVVEHFSVSPYLPENLNILNGAPCRSVRYASGYICGTPKAASPETVYTVTASNSTGSTSTTLSIVVRAGTPSNFAYPLATINATAGEAIPSDIPSVTGPVDAFSIVPALPAGLILNSATGTISGTPTAVTSQADYVVTAINSNGSTDTTVTISVAQANNTLLELGHAQAIQTLRLVGGHVLSADSSAHWALWDYSSGALLASGDVMPLFNNCVWAQWPAFCPSSVPTSNVIDMAGQIFVVAVANGLEVHAQSDGHLISLIVFEGLNLYALAFDGSTNDRIVNWWQLASDGSYISIGSESGLFLYSPKGQLILSKPGDYALAYDYPSVSTFSAPDAVHVAKGPAGANVIESISISDGTSTKSPPLFSSFHSWFADGARFLTHDSNTVFVYSNTGQQQAAVSLPTLAGLGGEGNWIWTDGGSLGSGFKIYPIGSETPALSLDYPVGVSSSIVPSASTLGFVSSEKLETSPGHYVCCHNFKFNVVDLSGPNPMKTDFLLPVEYPAQADASWYAASSSSQWIAGNGNGVILDGASLSNTPRYFGFGDAWSIAGSLGKAAISTANGKILIIDPYSQILQQAIDFSAGKVALSGDGRLLGASAYFGNSSSGIFPDQTLNFYSLPSGTITSSFPYSADGSSPELFDFSLSTSGTTMGRVSGVLQKSAAGPSWLFARQVSDIGRAMIWSDTPSPYNSDPHYIASPLLSPDGTLIAATLGPRKSQASITSILKDSVGGLASVPGFAAGWIDNNRLLINRYSDDYGQHYLGCSIYSDAGVPLASPLLPELTSFQPITADKIYDASRNTIYSLTTGQSVWTATHPISVNPFTSTGVGAVAGNFVVYKSGHRFVIEPF